ncbi:hypothetical protein QQ045_021306 [Rhodiola kirilowii]
MLVYPRTDAQTRQQQFLTAHNKARRAVGVAPLEWNTTVADYAQHFANSRRVHCKMGHSGGPHMVKIQHSLPITYRYQYLKLSKCGSMRKRIISIGVISAEAGQCASIIRRWCGGTRKALGALRVRFFIALERKGNDTSHRARTGALK